MKKFDYRKKMKLQIEVTPGDIDLLEDYLTTINLCDKHKGCTFGRDKISERELMTMYYECPDCEKIHKKTRDAAMGIWRKLCFAASEKGAWG